MFGTIRRIFGLGEAGAEVNGDVVSALERALLETNNSKMLDSACSLRNQLRRGNVAPTREEKVRIVKALNKAKVRALMAGDAESYSLFRGLNSVSSDVVALL
jgi:hypothetical protein